MINATVETLTKKLAYRGLLTGIEAALTRSPRVGICSAAAGSPLPRHRAAVERATLAPVIGNVGDTIVIESKRADASGRRGVIEDVFQQHPPRYQVRWEDGHTSILAPSAGTARIERKKPAAKGTARKKSGAKATA